MGFAPPLDLHPENMAAVAARGCWRGLVGAVALPRGEQGTVGGGPGQEQQRSLRREPLRPHLALLCLLSPRTVAAGRPSVLLLPMRRESTAADTRREYVRARPFSGLQTGALSFLLSAVSPCSGMPFPVSWQISARPWRPDCSGLHSAGRIGPSWSP